MNRGHASRSTEPEIRWCSPTQAKKHVIFLGAGASKTSGYPLANDLTLLMCDIRTFKNELRKVLARENGKHVEFAENSVITKFHELSSAAKILRDGDFVTMDELSNLALGGAHAGKILDLKRLMRLVFSLNNPDIYHFATSDYRPLIQKLFTDAELREDVTILSFNYDPYLDYRLSTAFSSRQQVRPSKSQALRDTYQAINSGLLDPNDSNWLSKPGFCHLKLHGTCVLPDPLPKRKLTLPVQPGEDPALTTAHLFSFETMPLLANLVQPPFSDQDPPALLPWEIIHGDGRLLTADEFTTVVGDGWQHIKLYPLFKRVWERAREEVQHADKVSFVGLSFGRFLVPEFKFLFAGKKGDLQVTIANPDNEKFKNYENPLHPNSPAGKVFDLLCRELQLEIKMYGSFSEYDRNFDERIYEASHQPTITCHSWFSDFIQAEL
jgi:hypothetical protein